MTQIKNDKNISELLNMIFVWRKINMQKRINAINKLKNNWWIKILPIKEKIFFSKGKLDKNGDIISDEVEELDNKKIM